MPKIEIQNSPLMSKRVFEMATCEEALLPVYTEKVFENSYVDEVYQSKTKLTSCRLAS